MIKEKAIMIVGFSVKKMRSFWKKLNSKGTGCYYCVRKTRKNLMSYNKRVTMVWYSTRTGHVDISK